VGLAGQTDLQRDCEGISKGQALLRRGRKVTGMFQGEYCEYRQGIGTCTQSELITHCNGDRRTKYMQSPGKIV